MGHQIYLNLNLPGWIARVKSMCGKHCEYYTFNRLCIRRRSKFKVPCRLPGALAHRVGYPSLRQRPFSPLVCPLCLSASCFGHQFQWSHGEKKNCTFIITSIKLPWIPTVYPRQRNYAIGKADDWRLGGRGRVCVIKPPSLVLRILQFKML